MAGNSAKKIKGFMTEVGDSSVRTRKAFPVWESDFKREKAIHAKAKRYGVSFSFSDVLEATYLEMLEAAEKALEEKQSSGSPVEPEGSEGERSQSSDPQVNPSETGTNQSGNFTQP